MRQGKILIYLQFRSLWQLFVGFGKSAFSAQILESLKPQNMPKPVMLPHSKSHLVVESFSGVKCGKGKFMESRYLLKS